MNSDVGRTGAHWVGAWREGGGGRRRVKSGARTKLRSRQTDTASKEWRAGWMDGCLDAIALSDWEGASSVLLSL